MQDNSSAYDSDFYDQKIMKTLPYYTEYFTQITDLVDASGKKNIDWLDTGCGTGTLAAKVFQMRDDVNFTLCDPSENMLDNAKKKLFGRNVRFMQLTSQQLPFSEEFDVVTAVQCHHYLTLSEREEAIRKCYGSLRSSGIFAAFENIKMSDDESDELTLRRWVRFLENNGKSQDEIEMQLSRRGTEVKPITIGEHIKLLEKVGFRSVNILWASYLQAGFWAIK